MTGQADFQGDPCSEQPILASLFFLPCLFASRGFSQFGIITTFSYGLPNDAILTLTCVFIMIIFDFEGWIFICEGREATFLSYFLSAQLIASFFVPEKINTVVIVPFRSLTASHFISISFCFLHSTSFDGQVCFATISQFIHIFLRVLFFS